ncbi:MAG TPA: hydroxymethylglutaryl-CoA reductase, degradative [Nitrososphaeraceae archaeon]|nr:hydroxymethylglutaryl-CoA reductase, degradative [Nitrososphaeraceae archaeon]
MNKINNKKDNNKNIKKFYELDHQERLEFLKKESHLTDQDLKIFQDFPKNFGFNNVNNMIENAIGFIPIPLGIATNFSINGRKYLIPMAIEEPSVIAAASKAAKIASLKNGFSAEADDSIMIGQIQLVSKDKKNNIDKFFAKEEREKVKKIISDNKKKLLEIANSKSKSVQAIDLQIREIPDESLNKIGQMIIVELIIDTKDAMGANVINTMCESIAPVLEKITKCTVILKILSNYSTKRMARCKAIFTKELIGGPEGVERILYAFAFAYSDTYRAVTHNKGLMNGIDGIAIATGQDVRAIEAAAHAYASKDGKYRSLTKWYKSEEGDLVGEIEIPLAIGIVGGITSVHPYVKTCLKILNITKAKELALIMVAVGLAQNFAAIRALADEGIQKGHMRLHARNIAITAGAKDEAQINFIANKLIQENNVTVNKAKEIIELINKNENENENQ